jgi:hypothetical protein
MPPAFFRQTESHALEPECRWSLLNPVVPSSRVSRVQTWRRVYGRLRADGVGDDHACRDHALGTCARQARAARTDAVQAASAVSTKNACPRHGLPGSHVSNVMEIKIYANTKYQVSQTHAACVDLAMAETHDASEATPARCCPASEAWLGRHPGLSTRSSAPDPARPRRSAERGLLRMLVVPIAIAAPVAADKGRAR